MVQVEYLLNRDCGILSASFPEKSHLERKPTDLTVPKRRWLRCHGEIGFHGDDSIRLTFMTRAMVIWEQGK